MKLIRVILALGCIGVGILMFGGAFPGIKDAIDATPSVGAGGAYLDTIIDFMPYILIGLGGIWILVEWRLDTE